MMEHPILEEFKNGRTPDKVEKWLESVIENIGRVIIESTGLEDELKFYLFELADTKPALGLTHKNIEAMKYFEKIEKFSEYVDQKMEAIPKPQKLEGEISIIEEWQELSRRLSEAKDARNQVAHGSWLYANEPNKVPDRVKWKTSQEIVYRSFNADALASIIDNITWTRAILHHFVRRLDIVISNLQ